MSREPEIVRKYSPESMSKVRILALDGGGVRGLSSLYILREIMEEIQRQKGLLRIPLPCEYFDLIGGTSTGGLIAIMLGRLRMSVIECIAKYVDLAKKVFKVDQAAFGIPVGHDMCRFDASDMEELIKQIVYERLGDESAQLADEAIDAGAKEYCPTFVVSAMAEDAKTRVIFRSYSCRGHYADRCAIWQAARATSAAPSFFSPVKIGHEGLFIDGGFAGDNNPARLALLEGRNLWDADHEFCVVSIGTGRQHPARLHTQSANSSQSPVLWSGITKLFKIARNVPGGVNALIDIANVCVQLSTNSERTHNDLSREADDKKNGFSYYRFNVENGLEDVSLNEWEEENRISQITRGYMTETFKEKEKVKCVEELLGGDIPVQSDRLLIKPLSPALPQLAEFQRSIPPLQNCRVFISVNDEFGLPSFKPSKRINHAKKELGLEVRLFESTRRAKVWLTDNVDFLKRNQFNVRILTDFTRDEEMETGWGTNHHAGEQLTDFVRSLGLSNIPILVFTHRTNIPATKEWTKLAPGGSTHVGAVVDEYVEGLAGNDKSNRWSEIDAGCHQNDCVANHKQTRSLEGDHSQITKYNKSRDVGNYKVGTIGQITKPTSKANSSYDKTIYPVTRTRMSEGERKRDHDLGVKLPHLSDEDGNDVSVHSLGNIVHGQSACGGLGVPRKFHSEGVIPKDMSEGVVTAHEIEGPKIKIIMDEGPTSLEPVNGILFFNPTGNEVIVTSGQAKNVTGTDCTIQIPESTSILCLSASHSSIQLSRSLRTNLQKLEITSTCGSITSWACDLRAKRIDIGSDSGHITGVFTLGEDMKFRSTSGLLKLEVQVDKKLPALDASLKSHSDSGSTDVILMGPLHHRQQITAQHDSKSGDIQLVYPEDWRGSVECHTNSGRIKTEGNCVRTVDGNEHYRKLVVGEDSETPVSVTIRTDAGDIDFSIV